jgi:hypothetical protein
MGGTLLGVVIITSHQSKSFIVYWLEELIHLINACVSAYELNPPEGTECEHKLTKTIGKENTLYAR